MSSFSGMFIAMSIDEFPRPRLLRAVNPPLGSYFRVGRDHKPVQALLAQDRAAFSGVVIDPWDHERQAELRLACAGGLETVLDTRVLELSGQESAANPKLTALRWAGDKVPHTHDLLRGQVGERLADLIADEVATQAYSAVLAPTHLLRSTDDPWLEVDVQLTRWLRAGLDKRGLSQVPIYFPLTMHSSVFASPTERSRIIMRLATAPIDALWLRIQPFAAATLGPLALRRYIEAARDLQRLGLPIVGEKTGTAGVALLAFGAIGGVESGITLGERFEINHLFKPPKPNDGGGFAPSPRVYLAAVGAFISRDKLQSLLAKPGMRTLLGCRDTTCCARGPVDTDRDPRRHFLIQRQGEINEISRRPEPVRAGQYLENFLRPATDRALRVAKVDPSFKATQERLEGWRLTLGAMNEVGPPASFALAPQGKRLQPHLQKNA